MKHLHLINSHERAIEIYHGAQVIFAKYDGFDCNFSDDELPVILIDTTETPVVSTVAHKLAWMHVFISDEEFIWRSLGNPDIFVLEYGFISR